MEINEEIFYINGIKHIRKSNPEYKIRKINHYDDFKYDVAEDLYSLNLKYEVTDEIRDDLGEI